jgi:hypothetical protein
MLGSLVFGQHNPAPASWGARANPPAARRHRYGIYHRASDRLVQGCGAGHWQASGRSRRVPGYISWYADSSSLDVVRSYRPTMLASALDDDAFGWPIVHHTWISAANCSTDEARRAPSFIDDAIHLLMGACIYGTTASSAVGAEF